MTGKIRFLLRYIHYYLTAQTKHDIHSPFLFDLVTKTICNRDSKKIFSPIEKIRRELLNNYEHISIRDFGAGFSGTVYHDRTISFITKNSGKNPKYSRLLYHLTNHLKPKCMIELGTSAGISAAYQSLGNPQGKFFTIEGCKQTAALAKQTFEKLEVNNIILINDEFENGLKKIFAERQQIDYVFIDGNHRKAPTLHYFDQCLNHSVPTAVFIIDDINWSHEMCEAWQSIILHPRVTISIDLFMMGIVFINPQFSKEHFRIRF